MSFGRSSGIIAVSPATAPDWHHSRPMLRSNLSRRVMERQFSRLPPLYKQTHICSFILVTSSIIILISIAPYHRIRDQGKNTSRTLWYANRMLLISMFVMATGISVDIWLVCAIATSTTLAWYIAVSVWSLAILVWFVLPYLRKEAT